MKKAVKTLGVLAITVLFAAGLLGATYTLQPANTLVRNDLLVKNYGFKIWLGQPVRLVHANPFSYAVSGMSWAYTDFRVHVKNVGNAASRVVKIHYKNGGSWSDMTMTKAADYGTHSLYTLRGNNTSYEFVVKYETSVGTYWDNNGGANYKVRAWGTSPWEKGAVGGNVGLVSARNVITATYTKYGGVYMHGYRVTANIVVENLSYNKTVGIRMSRDGGSTWYNVDGAYQYSYTTGGGNNVELWKVTHDFVAHPLTHDIRFAVYYYNDDWGTEYWDNNFYQDYTLGKADGSEVQ